MGSKILGKGIHLENAYYELSQKVAPFGLGSVYQGSRPKTSLGSMWTVRSNVLVACGDRSRRLLEGWLYLFLLSFEEDFWPEV